MRRLEPDEREVPELTSEDWDQVMEPRTRKKIYMTIQAFANKIMPSAKLRFEGAFDTPEFRWVADGKRGAYGVDSTTICQDLEYRAFEAAAVAFHRFDPVKAHGKDVSGHYLEKAITRELQHEFNRIRAGELTGDTVSYEEALAPSPRTGETPPEPSYLEEYDQDEPGDGLTVEDREALQTALGALSSREAWALRMVADGTPNAVIAETLGFKSEGSARNFINEAKRKAQAAYTEAQG